MLAARHLLAWAGVAKTQVREKRAERMVLENQNHIRDLISDIEQQTIDVT